MNRLYSVTTEGRIFYADSEGKFFQPLEYSDEASAKVRVKHLSSCDWCIWSVTSSFRVNLLVFKMITPYEFQEITFENQVKFF